MMAESWGAALASFLLAFPALFSIVNPVASALIFSQVTAGRTHRERVRLARLVALNSAIVLLFSLWGGAYVLSFFGISLAALRIAGGFVVAERAWVLLNAPEQNEAKKQEQAAPAEDAEGVAFFPLTIPFTTGPGSISVAIALGATRPAGGVELAAFYAGMSAAAVAIAVIVWLAYGSADRLVSMLGSSRARIVTRLSAFLLLCIGVQILLNGLLDVVTPLMAAR
ncbi:MAG TPA: NAAT family transporter [Azospirillaceae bacterium]|nr:NAAT family transporter [Azospirillaceae bacterium]